MGRSNPLRASSANAKHPPCQEPSPFVIQKIYNINVKFDTRAYRALHNLLLFNI